MSTAEMVYNLVQRMSDEKATMVLAFTEFLLQKPQSEVKEQVQSLSAFMGVLKNSPSFNEDLVQIQRELRDEWT